MVANTIKHVHPNTHMVYDQVLYVPILYLTGTVDKAGQTPLSLAYSNRHLETVKYLVQEQQCNPNCIKQCVCFVSVNHADLVVHSVVVNKDIDRDTPLIIECSHGHLDWVKALINTQIDPRSE